MVLVDTYRGIFVAVVIRSEWQRDGPKFVWLCGRLFATACGEILTCLMLSVHTIMHAFLDLFHFGCCTAQHKVRKNMSEFLQVV